MEGMHEFRCLTDNTGTLDGGRSGGGVGAWIGGGDAGLEGGGRVMGEGGGEAETPTSLAS